MVEANRRKDEVKKGQNKVGSFNSLVKTIFSYCVTFYCKSIVYIVAEQNIQQTQKTDFKPVI